MRYQRILRHGTSLAVVIPAPMARELGVKRGDNVRLSLLSEKVAGGETRLFYLVVQPVVKDATPLNL